MYDAKLVSFKYFQSLQTLKTFNPEIVLQKSLHYRLDI